MRTDRRFHRVWTLLVVTTLATPACYTLLKHPNVDPTAYGDTQSNRCGTCHTEDDLYVLLYPPPRPVPRGPVPPPWWWEDPWWAAAPSGPSAVRGFRPGDDKELYGPIVGPGPVIPPSGPKIVGGGVRIKNPDDNKGEKHEEEIRDGGDAGGRGKSANENNSNERPARPTSKKGKEDG